MYKKETEYLDGENNFISYYDVVINILTGKHYLVLPMSPRSEVPCLARVNLKTAKPNGKLRYPLTDDNSGDYKVIGNRGVVSE